MLSHRDKGDAVSVEKVNQSFRFSKTVRDFSWENNIRQTLKAAGLTEDNGYFGLSGIKLLERENALYFFVNWINGNKPKLEAAGITIKQDQLDKKYYSNFVVNSDITPTTL